MGQLANIVRWRDLADLAVKQYWPSLDPILVLAQIKVESDGNPLAKSPVGAQGLMQLMPGTARELGVTHPFEPAQNIDGGVRYLLAQYRALGEVPDDRERLRWAWASYNCGRGFIDFNGQPSNTCLELARDRGGREGVAEWWRWAYGELDLERVVFRGLRPDFKQVRDYVARIEAAAIVLGVGTR
jgi:soluble lytic murein transglycosylase-like protein